MATKTSHNDCRADLRSLLDQFPLSSRSQEVRVTLSDCIAAMYIKGCITRTEYHSAMAEVR